MTITANCLLEVVWARLKVPVLIWMIVSLVSLRRYYRDVSQWAKETEKEYIFQANTLINILFLGLFIRIRFTNTFETGQQS